LINKLNIPLVLLAGGKSSRMGQDKSLMPFGGYQTLIEYQYNKFLPYFSNIYISTKNKKIDLPNIILDDNIDIYSPMIALKSILKNIQSEYIFILPVDTPLITIDTINVLLDQKDNFDIVVAQSNDKIHNLCGVFAKRLLPTIEKYIQEDMHKINYLIKNVKTKIIQFSNDDEFINLNTIENYKNAVSLLKI